LSSLKIKVVNPRNFKKYSYCPPLDFYQNERDPIKNVSIATQSLKFVKIQLYQKL
jgi:hypothetical protein